MTQGLAIRAPGWRRPGLGCSDVCLSAALLAEGQSWLVVITQLLSATSFSLNQASLQDSLVPEESAPQYKERKRPLEAVDYSIIYSCVENCATILQLVHLSRGSNGRGIL